MVVIEHVVVVAWPRTKAKAKRGRRSRTLAPAAMCAVTASLAHRTHALTWGHKRASYHRVSAPPERPLCRDPVKPTQRAMGGHEVRRSGIQVRQISEGFATRRRSRQLR